FEYSIVVRVAVVRLGVFLQAEDGIRDATVTGVQTCALPILLALRRRRSGREQPSFVVVDERDGRPHADLGGHGPRLPVGALVGQIGRASCRERGWSSAGSGGGRRGRAEREDGKSGARTRNSQ